MAKNEIRYGFGKDYLKNWGIQQALREIYQNFLDYGDYEEIVTQKNNIVTVALINKWVPESLDFLRIGNSQKHNLNAIGKHGEGVKMAFLILERLGLKSRIFTQKYTVLPKFYQDKEIGECFAFIYRINKFPNDVFKITFDCPIEEFNIFKNNLIVPEDIIYSHEYGEIVNKEKGNIYSGNLFVIKCDNISKAYNIKPHLLPLDRDRSVPHSFDVSYYSSKINSDQGKITTKDFSYSDTLYIDKIPDEVKHVIEPKIIGNAIEFVFKDELGNDKIISNESIKTSLKQDNFFSLAIKKLKMFIAQKLGLYDLLIQFKEKHIHDAEALADFELILERIDK